MSGSVTDGPGAYTARLHGGPGRDHGRSPHAGTAIALAFSSFEMAGAKLRLCEGDDGTRSAGTLRGSFSGSSMPNPVTATSGSMHAVFTSDGSVEAVGFVASYLSSGNRRAEKLQVPATSTAKSNAGPATIIAGSSALLAALVVAVVAPHRQRRLPIAVADEISYNTGSERGLHDDNRGTDDLTRGSQDQPP